MLTRVNIYVENRENMLAVIFSQLGMLVVEKVDRFPSSRREAQVSEFCGVRIFSILRQVQTTFFLNWVWDFVDTIFFALYLLFRVERYWPRFRSKFASDVSL